MLSSKASLKRFFSFTVLTIIQCAVLTCRIMGDKGNRFRSVDCFFELGFLVNHYSAFVTMYLYPASCLIGRHYPTLIQCWKTMAMMLLMASLSCPVSNGTAPLISLHQILHLQKPVRFSRTLLNITRFYTSIFFTYSLSRSQAPITLNLRDLRKRRSPARCL